MKKILVLILFILALNKLEAQSIRVMKSNFGSQFGVLLNLGSHQTSVGLQVKLYVGFDYAQLNVGNTFTWNFQGIGKRKNYFENRAYLGGVVMFGKKESVIDFEIDGLNHQTKTNYGVAFNYLVYTDNAGTSQLSGAFGLHLKNFSILFENDVFGGQAKDRFRTGMLIFKYRTSWYKINAGLSIWTGETANSYWDKSASFPKMPNGYRSLEDLPYGRTSAGIVYGGVQFLLPSGSFTSMKIGLDSEHFRHAFQNRLTHDLCFLPKNFDRNTPHYPRLDENGCPTFEKNKVRKDQFYFQFGLNNTW